MNSDPKKINECYQKIHEILLNEWDPDKVKQIPGAQTEYDAFVYTVYSLLEAKASTDQLFSALKLIALEDMGIPRSPQLDEATRKAAAKLKALI